MANTTTMTSGKVQWNVETGKAFRDTLAVWHVYDFELADEYARRNKIIANFKGVIATNSELAEKIKNGEKVIGNHTIESLAADNSALEKRIAEARATLEKWLDGQKSARDKAESLFPKPLYAAYVAHINEGKTAEYESAIMDLLAENGFAPASETVSALVAAVAYNKGTGASKAETLKHNRAFSEKQWRQIFMGAVCDLMGNVLPTYKFKNILTRAEKKALREKSAK